jgi:uncharacterized protein with von Willebrand factor type A (vWA) domain
MSEEEGVLRGIDYEDAVVKYRGERIFSAIKKLMGREVNIKKTILTDLFYLHYLPFPIMKTREEVGKDSLLHYDLISFANYSTLSSKSRAYSIANSPVSMAITVTFAQNLIEELERIRKTSPDPSERKAAEKLLKMLSSKENLDEKELQDQKVQEMLKNVEEKAMSKAHEDANSVKNMQRIVGGTAAGIGSNFSLDADLYDVLRLARNAEIKKILDFLSGMPKLGIPNRTKYVKYSRGELAGYEKGDDLERLSSSELALPDELFTIKFAESDLILYNKIVRETMGPIYLLVDKSGSMDGEKILWAKAVALALYNRARKEGRNFHLRFFDNIPYPLIKVMKNVKGRDVLRMVEYIAKVRGGGGTDISRSLISACEDIKEGSVKGVSEIVLLTDGEDKIAESAVRRSLKAADAMLISVMIRGENPDLRRISDEYLVVHKLDHEDLLKVVKAKA